MSVFELDAADARVARVLHEWISNDEAAMEAVRAACLEAILHGSGSGPAAELYEAAHREGSTGYEYRMACVNAGVYVRDAVQEELGDALSHGDSPTLGQGLLGDLLDFGNRSMWAEVADGFMPHPDEVWEEYEPDPAAYEREAVNRDLQEQQLGRPLFPNEW